MKLLLVALLTIAAADAAPAQEDAAPAQEDTVTVPRESAEMLVKDNLRLQAEVDALNEQQKKLRKHIGDLQSSLNCS